MKLKTKLLLAGAFVMLMSILAGAWPLVLVGLAVVAWMGRSRWQSISPEARGGFALPLPSKRIDATGRSWSFGKWTWSVSAKRCDTVR